MIPNSPARVPLWLAQRKWRLDGRKRGDGAHGPATFRLADRMHWRFPVGRRWRWRWRPPADWSRAQAEAFNTYGPTPF
jgi:hypothetical protein